MHTLTFITALTLTMTAAACSSDVSTSNEGTFAITAHTLDVGCDGSDESVADQYEHTLLAIGHHEIIGRTYVYATSCTDSADCDARLAPRFEGSIEVSLHFGEGSDEDGFEGFVVSAGSTESPDECEGQWTDTALEFDGEGLRITMDSTAPVRYSSDNGGCDTIAAEKAARGDACAERTVIEANFQ